MTTKILNAINHILALGLTLSAILIFTLIGVRQHEINKIYAEQQKRSRMVVTPREADTEASVRLEVVVITKENVGLCSGEQILAPSGKSYVMTAGHCGVLMDDFNNIRLQTPDKVWHTAHLLKADPYNDVLVFSGISNTGLKIADKVFETEPVFTETHGLGFPTYRTDGRIIMLDNKIDVPTDPIVTDQDEQKCKSKPDQTIEGSIFGQMCVAHWHETMTSAFVAPGSSGGPVVNTDGELVGIVSISEADVFSGLVQLTAIQDLLRGM